MRVKPLALLVFENRARSILDCGNAFWIPLGLFRTSKQAQRQASVFKSIHGWVPSYLLQTDPDDRIAHDAFHAIGVKVAGK